MVGVPSSPLAPHDCRMFVRTDRGQFGMGPTAHRCDICGMKVRFD